MTESSPTMKVPFGDLNREMAECGADIRAAIDRVLSSGWFILGDEVRQFEAEFAQFLGGGAHVVGVASGTEALQLALMAAGVGVGDYVATVPNTAVPTVSAISAAGATPLLVDVSADTLTMDPDALRECVEREKPRLGEKLKAVVPVHLYGQCADMEPIVSIAREFGLAVVEDACQAHGAEYRGSKAGTLGDFAAFSFYPSKNLGCYGDGGAVVCSTDAGAERLRMLRNYGQSSRYRHEIKGVNSRLDEIQAAILRVKLTRLDRWLDERRHVAAMYDGLIENPLFHKPRVAEGSTHAWHLYVVRHAERERVMLALESRGVATLIHYPIPVHLQPAYADLGLERGAYPAAESAAAEVMSLPMFPQLRDDEVEHVCRVLNEV